MQHGPIALVDEQTPSVFVVPRGGIYPKVMSNLEEVKARRGPVIAIACEGDHQISDLADEVIFVPEVEEFLQPLTCAGREDESFVSGLLERAPHLEFDSTSLRALPHERLPPKFPAAAYCQLSTRRI